LYIVYNLCTKKSTISEVFVVDVYTRQVYNESMIREKVRRKWHFSAFSTFPNKNILKEDLFNGSNRLEWLCRRKVAERS